MGRLQLNVLRLPRTVRALAAPRPDAGLDGARDEADPGFVPPRLLAQHAGMGRPAGHDIFDADCRRVILAGNTGRGLRHRGQHNALKNLKCSEGDSTRLQTPSHGA
jgi:hypothetical protein